MAGDIRALDELRARIRRIEGGYGEPRLRRHLPTELGLLDRALAGGGLPAGAVAALLSAGAGPAEAAWTVAVIFAAAVLRADHGEAVLVDRAAELYPPAISALGLPLDRLLLVRPAWARDGPWALAEALGSPAVAVTVGEVSGPGPPDVRRLELAAEAGGGVGIALARERDAGALVRAPTVIRVRPCPAGGGGMDGRAGPARAPGFRLEVLRSRGRVETDGEVALHVTADSVSCVAGPLDRSVGEGRAGPGG